MTSHPNTGNNFEENRFLKRKLKRLYNREADIRDEVEYAASLSLKKLRMEVAIWLTDVEKFRNDFPWNEAASEDCLLSRQQVDIMMKEAEDLMRDSNFLNGLFKSRETKVNKLLEGKMVGEAFQRNATKILDFLVGNQVSRLGIYGMGGVGKTTIVKHIHNRLLEKENYGNVLWINLSQDFNAQKLQDDIWEALGLGTLHVKDVSRRAAMLFHHLTKRGKSTIILDDVWEYFDLEEAGIPIKADGFKLVLTTRSSYVCCQMQCQETMKIEPLSEKEAESLFMEELASKEALNLETKAVVKSIVKECAGLPLGVVTMARSMRGMTDVFEWKNWLVKLGESDMGKTDMEKVLRKLEFSYNCLGNHEVQQCFLSCALYPEDKLIDKLELIEFFIDQGLIDGSGLNTREKQYDRGLTILNKLENVCLLEDHGSMMKMHDLIRDMALHVMGTTSIVKARKQLRNVLHEEYLMDSLEKVSLMENKIGKIPSNVSPNCPKLSTLLLNGSLLEDAVIPDSFFEQLCGLKVLNLSGCDLRELPNSISDLVNLRALLLGRCKELRRIPYLGKLTSLRKLDASNCQSLVALEGLEKLLNLRYLDLTKTRIERLLPEGTLDSLLNLQCLKGGAVNQEDITKLRALETFRCYLENADDFNKCVRVIEQSHNPRYYALDVGKDSKFIAEVSDDARFRNLRRIVHIWEWDHAIVSVGREGTSNFILIPQDVRVLLGVKCHGITDLSGIGPLEYLEKLIIEVWEKLEVLCGGQDEVINIRMVEMISGVGQGQEGSIMTPVNNTPSSFQSSISLPNLRELDLLNLPQLKSICGVPISCDSIKKLRVNECPELKAIPLQLRLRDIDIDELPHIWVEDEEKWKTLTWDDPNAQAILQPYLRKGENARNGFPWRSQCPPNAIGYEFN
ncbi:hypothetical protein BT93_F1064 [Corymbia citriodora subsp. variegata]|nr:hypothetical protein BT93_F1064 [Corymbia citriodora subsp. variegata]